MKHPVAKMSNCQEEESKGYDSQEFETEIILFIVIYIVMQVNVMHVIKKHGL